MPEERYITIVSERKTIALRVSTILYVLMNGKYANIHVLGDHSGKCRSPDAKI